MTRVYRDPTCDAIERLELQSCDGCPMLGFNPLNRQRWCADPKWDDRETQRPGTMAGAPRLHRCTQHPEENR